MKRILITNDDGITASGILRLAEAARAFGEVTVIAPETQRSAYAHSITLHAPLAFTPHPFPVPGVKAWACSGTPADCIRAGLACLLPEKPDAVLAGINYGINAAAEIQYSGTVGAALEAAHEGVAGIALSEDADPDHSVTDRFLGRVLSMLLARKHERDVILNVNFPSGFCRGILEDRTVSAGAMYKSSYRAEPLPAGGLRLTAEGCRADSCEDGSDLRAVLDHYISIGPVGNIGRNGQKEGYGC